MECLPGPSSPHLCMERVRDNTDTARAVSCSLSSPSPAGDWSKLTRGDVGFLPSKSELSRYQTIHWCPPLFLSLSGSYTDSLDPTIPRPYHEALVYFLVLNKVTPFHSISGKLRESAGKSQYPRGDTSQAPVQSEQDLAL